MFFSQNFGEALAVKQKLVGAFADWILFYRNPAFFELARKPVDVQRLARDCVSVSSMSPLRPTREQKVDR